MPREKNKPINLAVLISNKGAGSNLAAIIKAIKNKKLSAKIQIVISDREQARGLILAKNARIPTLVQPFIKTHQSRDEYGKNLAMLLNKNGINIAILAGFMTILPKTYFETFTGITINIHPGLIPDNKSDPFLFPDKTKAPWNQGLSHEKAVSNFLNCTYAGSTIHGVTQEADYGPVLKRCITKVKKNDTVETLYKRLKKREHYALIATLRVIT